jgi:glutaminase
MSGEQKIGLKASFDSIGERLFESSMPATSQFVSENLKYPQGHLDGYLISSFLSRNGLLRDDPRFKLLYSKLLKNEHQYRTFTYEEASELFMENQHQTLVERAFKGTLVVPDFPSFKDKMEEIFSSVQRDVPVNAGKNADYIPQLEKVSPSLWGLSVCTIDGQRFSLGDANKTFSIQSCIKPLNYCLAIEEFGEKLVHEHLGREPSGVKFNSLTLDSRNRPHNPMINAGAIMACSLIKPRSKMYERFDYVSGQMQRLSGGQKWGFSNTVYLSEKCSADSNYCLGYMMQGHKAFPEGTDLNETLDFYFQCCSLETDCDRLAVAGATLANMGVCPTTREKIFRTRTCRHAMSLMYSCGLVLEY